MTYQQGKFCLFCGSVINQTATVCPHCRRDQRPLSDRLWIRIPLVIIGFLVGSCLLMFLLRACSQS